MNNYKEIVKLINRNHGFVFGGYVRDMLIGVQPTDVDCSFPSITAERHFKSDLLSRFGSFKTLRVDEYYYAGYFNLERIVVSPSAALPIQIDIVNRPVFLPDFDVNMLKLYGGCLRPMYWLTVEGILDNIVHRKAKRLSFCSDKRAEKMEAKGWTIIE